MAGKPNVALRVAGIVVLSGVTAVASLLFLLLAACGALTVRGSDAWAPPVIVGVYALILGGGFYGIFKLAKGMSSAPVISEGPAPAASAPLSTTPAETRKLLEALRLAMGASIGLSFLAMVSLRLQAQGQGVPMPLILLPSFVVYQLPYVAAFWLTRAGPERKGVGLAMTFSAVSVLHGMWSWGTLLFFNMRMSNGMQPGVLISLADVVATGAAAFFAFQLWRRGPESRNDIAILVAGILGSIVYLAVAQFVQQFVILRGLMG